MRALVWFRADLRTKDNHALSRATRDATRGTVGLFVVCPDQWREHDWAPIKVDFILRTLRELRTSLAKLNIPLVVRECARFDECPTLVATLAKDLRCDALYFNREYEVNETARDAAVARAAEKTGMTVHACTDQVVLAPGSVLTKQDGWYTVYTPFKKRWLAVADETGVGEFPNPRKQPEMADADARDVPDRVEHFRADDDARTRWADTWAAGEVKARRALGQFVSRRIDDYASARDLPAEPGTSRLSPHLTVGSLSPRQCVVAAATHNDGRTHHGAVGPDGWIEEIVWREFYKHLLVGFPRLCMHKSFRAEYDAIEWSDSDRHFEAWRDGCTGYPIVDAGMRQLRDIGWMHNRVRMITAMFLTKHLFIDWRRGERHFMRRLIDGDLASNNGGWQWSASTGTDAQPYFRVFNPTTQSERFDSDGVYIRRYVDELRGVRGKAIHAPVDRGAIGSNEYPAPIVDHKAARERAIQAFKDLRT